MKRLLTLAALTPAFVFGAHQTTTSASLSYADREDVLGTCKSLLTGLHVTTEEESGFGSLVEIMWATGKNFHIIYTNSEVNFRILDHAKISILPTLSWKNLWRGVQEKEGTHHLIYPVSSTSSQHGMAYLGFRVLFPLSDYLTLTLHPQIFYEAVSIQFWNNHESFRGKHYQKSSGFSAGGSLEGTLRGKFSYFLGSSFERSFNGLTKDLKTTLKINYGF
jgi:hypothetical protein